MENIVIKTKNAYVSLSLILDTIKVYYQSVKHNLLSSPPVFSGFVSLDLQFYVYVL